MKRENELHERILDAWNELDQVVIDAFVQQWRSRLQTCIASEGGQYEPYINHVHISKLLRLL